MDDDNGYTEKKFPGLFASDIACRSDSDYVESSPERLRRELILGSRKDRGSDRREKGYAALQSGESSEGDMDSVEARAPVKVKKASKSFKFLHKKDKDRKEEKREDKRKKEKDEKDDLRKLKKEKKKEKEELKREKEEKKKIKKDKKRRNEHYHHSSLPIFGVLLPLAVERNPCHDGIPLPSVVREAVDFIEERGLSTEGIYRLGGVKSQVHSLKRKYNSGERVDLTEEQPHAVATLFKLFLRELPEPILTTSMLPHFHDVSLIPNPHERSEAMRQLVMRLPLHHQVLLQYILKHMAHVIEKEKETKMSQQSICIILSPIMLIPHRVLNVMFLSQAVLLKDVTIIKYHPPLCSCNFNQSLDTLSDSSDIRVEIGKQDSLLAYLHKLVAIGVASRQREEELWDAQRILTLLKRRLKAALRKESGSLGSLEKDVSSEDSQEGIRMNRERERELKSESEEGEREQIITKVIEEDRESEETSSHLVHKFDNMKVERQKFIEDSPKERKLSTVEPPTGFIYPLLPKPLSAREEKNKKLLHGEREREYNFRFESGDLCERKENGIFPTLSMLKPN